jgi:hypothetical protein
MIVLSKNYYIIVFIFLMLCAAQIETKAQNILGKNISLVIRQQKLSKALTAIEQQGNFKFSYNSTILPLDSLIDLNVANLSIAETLDKLFKQRYEYREAYNFIIIRYAPLQLALITQESIGDQNLYTITGKVVDEYSRKPIANASVYEKSLLQSTLTDQDGAFTLKLKNISQTVVITISKLNYKDATSFFLPEITVFKNKRKNSNRYIDDAPSELEQTFLGRSFITSKQKIQSVNTGGFIANAPAQISLGPGLSSHGSLSGQVINKFSFNITGDYNAGVDGMEIGLLYNIDKRNVRVFQFGGTFNLVGGKFTGLQISGLHNDVLKSVNGIQISVGYNRIREKLNGVQIGGLYNDVWKNGEGVQISVGYNQIQEELNGVQIGGFVNVVHQNIKGIQLSPLYNFGKKSMSGFQLGGFHNRVLQTFKGLQFAVLYNQTNGEFKGMQLAGLFNNLNNNFNGLQFSTGYNRIKNKLTGWQIGAVNTATQVKGTQLALLGNFTRKEVNGLQVGGIFNYTKNLKGLQIGLINIADTSSGYSLGLINIIKKGYHKISLSTNESIDFNAALKTGNDKLYTQVLFGKNLSGSQKLTALGIGLGKEFNIGKQFSLNPEVSSRYIYQGNWKYRNILNRLDVNISYRLTHWLAVDAGPAFNFYYTKQTHQIAGYDFIGSNSSSFKITDTTKGWLGWNFGVTLF